MPASGQYVVPNAVFGLDTPAAAPSALRGVPRTYAHESAKQSPDLAQRKAGGILPRRRAGLMAATAVS